MCRRDIVSEHTRLSAKRPRPVASAQQCHAVDRLPAAPRRSRSAARLPGSKSKAHDDSCLRASRRRSASTAGPLTPRWVKSRFSSKEAPSNRAMTGTETPLTSAHSRILRGEGEGNQAGPNLRQRQSKLLRQPVAEVGRPQFWKRQATRGYHQRLRTPAPARDWWPSEKAVGLAHLAHPVIQLDFHA